MVQPANQIILTIPPLVFLLLIATNNVHHLVRTGFSIDQYVIPSTAILNRIFMGYGYILGLINLVVLVWLAVRSPRHRWPVAIMLSGQITEF